MKAQQRDNLYGPCSVPIYRLFTYMQDSAELSVGSAMPAKRNVLAEIEEIRGRMTAVDDLDSGILKLLTIVMSTEKLKDDDQEDELHAYFIVASIAAVETYFRWQDFAGSLILATDDF